MIKHVIPILLLPSASNAQNVRGMILAKKYS